MARAASNTGRTRPLRLSLSQPFAVLVSASVLATSLPLADNASAQSTVRPAPVGSVEASPLPPISLKPRRAVEVIADDPVKRATFSAEPLSPVISETENDPKCRGKLGVHRTIKVSRKNALLVGVDNHARLGLRRKELILTFDDGPVPGLTEGILKILKEECVKATFFSVGRQARGNPRSLVRVARDGHTIGTHTQSHPLLIKRKIDVVDREIKRGVDSIDAALKGSGYKASNFFRYPYLGRNRNTDKIVDKYGLIAFHMNIDSWDWKDTTPEEMVKTTLRRTRSEGSGVVLFHDVQARTVKGLPAYLRAIKREGYKIVHIVPGESDFDYRIDVARRIPTPLARPADAPRDNLASIRDLRTRRNGTPVFHDIQQSDSEDEGTRVASADPKGSLTTARARAFERLRSLNKKHKRKPSRIGAEESSSELKPSEPAVVTTSAVPLPRKKPRRARLQSRTTTTPTRVSREITTNRRTDPVSTRSTRAATPSRPANTSELREIVASPVEATPTITYAKPEKKKRKRFFRFRRKKKDNQ